MNKHMRWLALCGTAISAVAGSHAAVAQDGASAQVEDIIVTAQRRDERLQDVPVAVSVASAVQLEAAGINTVIDVRIAAPSLNSTAASGIFASSIRGVGSFGFSPGLESPVALYIDGVYLATPLSSELALNNVASLEVLKGPQGTLFGRNATGGLIQITTATPTQQTKGKFSLEYGRYNDLIGTGYLSGGLSGNLAADIAVRAERRDGIGKNITTGSDAGDIHHDVLVRSKVVWTPGTDTTITAIGNYWDGRNSLGYAVGDPGTVNGWSGRINPDLGYDTDTNDDFQIGGWTAGGSLKIEQDVGDVRLTSISAYRKALLTLKRDLDYSPDDIAFLDLRQTDKQISQELQASSTGSGRLKWTAGLFYFNLTSAYPSILVDLSKSVNQAAITINAKQRGESGAVYGQATYEIFDGTNLTLGGRYTSEKRREVDSSQFIQPVGFPGFTLSSPDRSRTDSRFTYRVSLDHRFSDELMAYASLNTGFKSGGYNTNSPGEAPFAPEKLTAYEVGIKADLLDRRLRLNLAGFYYDYSDLQVQRVGTFALIVFNGAKSRIYGLDADFTANISRNLSLTGGFAWIDTKFKNFDGCPISQPGGGVPQVTGSCTGNALPFAAKFAGSLAANYTTQVGAGEFQASGNVYYNSGYFFESDNVSRQPRYAKLGASLKWTSDSGYSISVVGRNLTDRRTLASSGTQTNGNVGVTWADPRTYSVVLGIEF